MTKITLGRTLSNQAYGGLPYETTRMEVEVEGDDPDALRDEAKKIIDEWTDLLIKEIEMEDWGLSVEEWENLDLETKGELQEAKRAISRSRYHKQKAHLLMKKRSLLTNQ